MTDADHAGHAALLSGVSADWCRKVIPVVAAAVDRAHAHSVVALTEALRVTPDGRRSLRKAANSRSYLAGVADLDALATSLAGPSVASLDGLLRDAREAAYRAAFASWISIFPEAISVGPDASPTLARIADVRGLVLHGMELRREVVGKIDPAKRTLLANLEMSARRADARSADRLAGWKVATTADLSRMATVAIGDAIVAIDAIAGIDAAKPEFRPTGFYYPG